MMKMCNEKAITIFNRRIPFSTETEILFAALVVYLTCAVFSSGFYYPDEHFQILEFAKWKMGEATPMSMA